MSRTWLVNMAARSAGRAGCDNFVALDRTLLSMSVFVSIASYCDPVLGFTLARALATARWPENLHFGVVEQGPASRPALNTAGVAPARLSYLRFDPVYARGPCWARSIAM